MHKTYPVTRSDAQWRQLLTPEQFHLMRERNAERQGTSALVYEKRLGTFSCAGCDSPLFESHMKFDSGTGWPSFREPIPGAVDALPWAVTTPAMARFRQNLCATCGSHLGHVFNDGPPPAGLRYCINGVGLKFTLATG
jgi:peptide-methionine (R)-S-oxide reductase